MRVVFAKLAIKIDGATLKACFAMELICKKVPLTDIAGCERIRLHWWYGWGIHLTPYGWLYNVSGLEAVAIRLRNDRKFALGTMILRVSQTPFGIQLACNAA